MENTKWMSRKKYVSLRKRHYVDYCSKNNRPIDLILLKELIKQWEFDYEMERLHGT